MIKFWFLFSALFLLVSCVSAEKISAPVYTPSSFDQLPNWSNDQQSEAIAVFARSCAILAKKHEQNIAGEPRDWKPACTALALVPAHDNAAARKFFET